MMIYLCDNCDKRMNEAEIIYPNKNGKHYCKDCFYNKVKFVRK